MNPSSAELPPAELAEHQYDEILASGLSLERYRVIRLSGATHDEIMEAHVLGADLEAYTLFRANHAHRRALDEAGAPNSPTHLEAGRLGVTDEELAEVRASHQTTVAAYWAVLSTQGRRPEQEATVTRVGDYLTARRAGLPHAGGLRFAQRVSTLTHRPDSRDLLQWARCLAAGLDFSRLFHICPKTQRSLVGYELEVLHALLFAVRTHDINPVGWDEMEWVAVRAAGHRHPFRVHAYLDARLRGRPRRTALRWATRPI